MTPRGKVRLGAALIVLGPVLLFAGIPLGLWTYVTQELWGPVAGDQLFPALLVGSCVVSLLAGMIPLAIGCVLYDRGQKERADRRSDTSRKIA